MIRLQLVIVNLFPAVHQHGGPSRPRQNCHSCIFETKENSNLRICIQYLGHHSKTTCQKSAKSMRYRVRPKFEFYRKLLLKDPPRQERVFQTRVFPSHWLTAMPCWWAPLRAKQLSMAADCPRDMAVRMRDVMAVGWCMCAPCFNLLVTRDPPSPRMSW